jgi:hypothetical protein
MGIMGMLGDMPDALAQISTKKSRSLPYSSPNTAMIRV